MLEITSCLGAALLKTAVFTVSDWATTSFATRMAGPHAEANPLAKSFIAQGQTVWYFIIQFIVFSIGAFGFSYFGACYIYDTMITIAFAIIAWNIYNIAIIWRGLRKMGRITLTGRPKQPAD